eukprot:scaffold176798_cov22-Tisochrysis_lutea.AAC.3
MQACTGCNDAIHHPIACVQSCEQQQDHQHTPSKRFPFPHLLVVPHGTLHLVVVDGDAHDVGARHGADRAHGAPDSAATVQDLVPGLGLQHGGDACLMGCLRALPGLVGQLGGEVEALAPAPEHGNERD